MKKKRKEGGCPPSAVSCDLHTHSFYSDGALSPEETAQAAAGKNVRYWALTDHDTVDGLPEAAAAAAAKPRTDNKKAGTTVPAVCLKKNPARSSADESNLPLRTGGCPANGFMLPHRASRVDPDGAVCNPPPDSRLPMDD